MVTLESLSLALVRSEEWWCGARMMKRRSILIALLAVVISSVALNLYCRTLIT